MSTKNARRELKKRLQQQKKEVLRVQEVPTGSLSVSPLAQSEQGDLDVAEPFLLAGSGSKDDKDTDIKSCVPIDCKHSFGLSSVFDGPLRMEWNEKEQSKGLISQQKEGENDAAESFSVELHGRLYVWRHPRNPKERFFSAEELERACRVQEERATFREQKMCSIPESESKGQMSYRNTVAAPAAQKFAASAMPKVEDDSGCLFRSPQLKAYTFQSFCAAASAS